MQLWPEFHSGSAFASDLDVRILNTKNERSESVYIRTQDASRRSCAWSIRPFSIWTSKWFTTWEIRRDGGKPASKCSDSRIGTAMEVLSARLCEYVFPDARPACWQASCSNTNPKNPKNPGRPSCNISITRLSILTWFPNLLVLVRDAQRSCRIGWKAGPVSS